MRLTPEIIAAMHELALDQRRELGVRAPWHVGDITWGLFQHEGRENEWTIRVWREGGRTVAWSWLTADGSLQMDVRRDRLQLLDEILDEPEASTAYCFSDDDDLRPALVRHGFAQPGHEMHFLALELPEPPEPLPLPDGFLCRTVEEYHLAERVAIHRDVWAPSRVTEASFAKVRAH